MRLEGQVAVVTGGASGIGAATRGALEAEGALTVVWDVQAGGTGVPRAIVCDVSSPPEVEGAMAETLRRFGSPSAMVTCAGVASFQTVAQIDPGEWQRVMAVNLTGTMLCLKEAAAAMDRGGSIVCISSINATLADRGMAAYCCSKAGVEMLVKVAAAELGERGVRVNAVAPGVVDTPMSQAVQRLEGFVERVSARTPLGRVGSPAQIAQAVLALIGADWVTGQALVVDGGLITSSPVDTYGLMRSR